MKTCSLEQLKKNNLIDESTIPDQPDKIYVGILDNDVDLEIVKSFFSSQGWIFLNEIIKIKRQEKV